MITLLPVQTALNGVSAKVQPLQLYSAVLKKGETVG